MSRRGAAIELAAVELAFVAVLARLWPAQRALWTNGFDPHDPFAMPHARTDLAAGAADAELVAVLGAALTGLWLWLALRSARWDTPVLRIVALGVPALAALVLFVLPPTLSIDAYSYLSHGRLALTPGRNPYLDASASLRDTPYGALLGAAGWLPVHPQTPYGPLWTLLERIAVALSGNDVAVGVRLVKLPALLGLGAAAWLTWDLVGRSRPEQRLRAVLLVAASPLSLVELAGDGHNDGLMVALVLLCLTACVRRRPALAIVALAAAVLVKATPLPLALPIAAHLVATRRSGRRLALEAGVGVVLAAGLAALLTAPYWAGAATFQGLAASGAVT
ncbi:MAG: glycosyltransferase 87 family protein, partial [Amnibacterium sp.]